MKWKTHGELRLTIQTLASDGLSVKAICRRLRIAEDLVYKLLGEPTEQDMPTMYPRGSDERMEVYRMRIERGLVLHNEADAVDRVPAGYISSVGKGKANYRKGANKNR